jgi:hypothetical protein
VLARELSYSAADKYVNARAVRDRKLITATGVGDVEFARELFEELEVLTKQERSFWANPSHCENSGGRCLTPLVADSG